MDTLLEKVDAIKQKITDQEYRELMDTLKEVNNNKISYELKIIELYDKEGGRLERENRNLYLGTRIITYIPKWIVDSRREDYDVEKLEKMVKETKEFGHLNPPIPVSIHRSSGKVYLDEEEGKMFFNKNPDWCDADCLVEYQEHSVIAVNKVKI